MITIKTKEEIEILREGGRRLAEIMEEILRKVKPGASSVELNDLAEKMAIQGGDKPAFLNYRPYGAKRPYPASLCVSVNDEIVHGIPNEGEKILKEGNNIYVGGKNGQYLKVLSKDPNLSAEEGIGKAILTGYPAEDCFINNRTNEQYIKDNFPNGYYYISPVDYPNIAKGDEPFWIGSGKCPNEYAKTNGIRYFLGDENHPDKFLFFSIGQYGIPLDENNNDSKLWQSTVRFID